MNKMNCQNKRKILLIKQKIPTLRLQNTSFSFLNKMSLIASFELNPEFTENHQKLFWYAAGHLLQTTA